MRQSPIPTVPALAPLTAAERAANLHATMAQAPKPDTVWVFAYGSLIWDPCFGCAEQRPGRLAGYRRAFNFWSVLSRGTPANPGLGLGLAEGGDCDGIVYRLSAESLSADLEAIWQREMHSAVYEPRWLPIETAAGPRQAIAFVTATGHGQFAGELEPDHAAGIIARASGENGPCRDYLASTIAALADHGIDDPFLNDLLARVMRHEA